MFYSQSHLRQKQLIDKLGLTIYYEIIVLLAEKIIQKNASFLKARQDQ